MNRARIAASAAVITAGALVMLGIGALTLFTQRRLYARMAAALSGAVLGIHGVRIRVHSHQPFPRHQTVYISNHTSTLDVFLIVALRLPNCRYFLSGFLRKVVPVGVIAWLLGTFFTVPQDRPQERRRIFRRAAATLRRSGESVYLSPEGGRITTGEIGHFNKGAFHLATDLQVPIQPMYFRIPDATNPGRGYRARPGTVEVHLLPPIDTTTWTVKDLPANTARVREVFVRFHEEMRSHAKPDRPAA